MPEALIKLMHTESNEICIQVFTIDLLLQRTELTPLTCNLTMGHFSSESISTLGSIRNTMPPQAMQR